MYTQIFMSKIEELKNEGTYRIFTQINRVNTKYPLAKSENNDDIIVFCSNDYLGMSQNNKVLNTMIRVLKEYGAGSGGSRNIGGTHKYFSLLEKEISDWHNKESALIFPTGYSSNDATLQGLLRTFPNMIVFSDEKNHASIINGLRSVKNNKEIFKHNDLSHLEALLKKYDYEIPKLIVFESIYSMDGDVAPIKEIVALAKKYNALTFLDEVHAIGMYGKEGAGYSSLLNVQHEIDVIQSTMAKGIGIIGGYIAGDKYLIDVIRSFSSGFIFTTALPPVIVAGCLESIKHLRNSSIERELLHEKTRYLREKLSLNGIIVLKESTTHILPIIIGDSKKCTEAAQMLLKNYNIYVQAINFPTVSKGTERFRINVTPYHTIKQIDFLVNSLVDTFDSLDITRMNKS
ncbi:5-aminolevulinate synthase [Staphylococcus massiliensis]|uniref:Putative pyridoxal phosphate-dependent acyltransferase n=1 Tax=Staphylococcus massiliensis S46 TaxID=1229783 RepID=K9B072_9STAP|nr:5-aminolevulinate synthase [Staphylococcus massiliensis]EKU48207.1 5-aminolevulinate synthase [Staphylococcus massiliensis S46]MCG3399531.1 5-aminolevulinate synthase [Staphylococcus massiliensis]MCG3402040.1 5-aminolevulinate synthase [Staphylococcus massiliensis]MCG3412709.1 5-aminolevulinate synthase [Staphylococcus massiliensis]